MSALRGSDVSRFHAYIVNLSTKYDLKKAVTLRLKPCFRKTASKNWWLIEGKNWATSDATTLV